MQQQTKKQKKKQKQKPKTKNQKQKKNRKLWCRDLEHLDSVYTYIISGNRTLSGEEKGSRGAAVGAEYNTDVFDYFIHSLYTVLLEQHCLYLFNNIWSFIYRQIIVKF